MENMGNSYCFLMKSVDNLAAGKRICKRKLPPDKKLPVAGEIRWVAEAEETVVIVPVILEVAEVELPVTVRVAVHVRHPVVAVGVHTSNVREIIRSHRTQHQPDPAFHSEFLNSPISRTDLFYFFHKRRHSFGSRNRRTTRQSLIRDFDSAKPWPRDNIYFLDITI